MNHIDELSKIRKIAANLATAKDVPPAIGDSARYVLQSMIEEAEDHGFTKAEVIRAMFRPVFRPQKGCDCFTCKARRDAASCDNRVELVQAIRTVHEGGSLLQPVIARRLAERIALDEASGLSKRQHEVLQLLASGRRNQEIADQLFLSLSTVKFHIENIYQKLGIRSRTEAVRVARERGILFG